MYICHAFLDKAGSNNLPAKYNDSSGRASDAMTLYLYFTYYCIIKNHKTL